MTKCTIHLFDYFGGTKEQSVFIGPLHFRLFSRWLLKGKRPKKKKYTVQ